MKLGYIGKFVALGDFKYNKEIGKCEQTILYTKNLWYYIWIVWIVITKMQFHIRVNS